MSPVSTTNMHTLILNTCLIENFMGKFHWVHFKNCVIRVVASIKFWIKITRSDMCGSNPSKNCKHDFLLTISFFFKFSFESQSFT